VVHPVGEWTTLPLTSGKERKMQFIAENLWFIIIAVIVIFGGGAWFIISTGFIHRIFDWMKPTSDKYVPAKVFCEDKQIRDRKLKIGRYVISDEKKKRSFYLVHSLLLSPVGSVKKFLALTERSARPVDFHNKITDEEWKKYPTAQRVFIDTTADIRSQSSKEATSNFMAMSLSIMAICAAIIVVIMGIVIFFTTRGVS
jgi:hypothetical protein